MLPPKSTRIDADVLNTVNINDYIHASFMFGWMMNNFLSDVRPLDWAHVHPAPYHPQKLVHILLLLCFSCSVYGRHCSTLPPCCLEHYCMCCLSVSIQHVSLKALSFQFVDVWFWRTHNSQKLIFGSILIYEIVDMKL